MKNRTDLPSLDSALEAGQKISDLGITKQFEPGEAIVNEHASVRSIPFITKGSVKVMQSDEDYKEMVLYYLRPGETCIMSFLAGVSQDTSKVRAVAEEACEVVFIPVHTFQELIGKHPEWLSYIFQIYHMRFEELLEVVNAISFKKMDVRLLQFLQKRCAVMQTDTLSLTHEQLAHELGTAREVVSRLLKQLENEGMVELGRNRIRLLTAGKQNR